MSYYNNMTKTQLEHEKEYFEAELDKVNKRLKAMQKAVKIADRSKSFSSFTLAEIAEIYNNHPSAYDWFQKNKDKSIDDYNQLHTLERIEVE